MRVSEHIATAALSVTLLGIALAAPIQDKVQQPSKTRPITATQPVKAPGESDKQFMKTAAMGGAAEIELGQLAQSKASDPKVKQFGQRMVKDHSKAADELKSVAESQHIALPTGIDREDKAAKSRLSKLAGAEFDKSYMRLMVQEHTKTVDKFKREAEHGYDNSVKKFAQETLPTLESHLSEARQIEAGLSSGTSK